MTLQNAYNRAASGTIAWFFGVYIGLRAIAPLFGDEVSSPLLSTSDNTALFLLSFMGVSMLYNYFYVTK